VRLQKRCSSSQVSSSNGQSYPLPLRERSVDSVNIMDGDPMVLSSGANKRSSCAFGELIRDPRMEAERLVKSCQGSSQGFCMLAAASTQWPRLVTRERCDKR
jgi:hypothetical protein